MALFTVVSPKRVEISHPILVIDNIDEKSYMPGAIVGDIDHIESHVTVDSPDDSPIDLLQQASGLSRQRIKFAMTQGAVWVTRGRNTQRLRRAKRALREGDELHLYYDATILAEIPAEPALLADVGGYSVWRKPYGLRSQGSKWGDHCTVVRWAERHLQPERPAFTVHRLDRAANGLMLVAHSKSMAANDRSWRCASRPVASTRFVVTSPSWDTP